MKRPKAPPPAASAGGTSGSDAEIMDALENFEQKTIERAEAGDVEAGWAAVHLCEAGLVSGQISEPLRFYLARHLREMQEGVPLARALCVDPERERGRQSDRFPEWQVPYAALAAILARRGCRPGQIDKAMSNAREAIEHKEMSRIVAGRIRKKYQAMRAMPDRLLLHLCAGPVATFIQDSELQTEPAPLV